MATKKSVWETLSKIDVSKHIEKKDGLTYLSWAWAWGELKKNYPDANYEILKQENGLPYFDSDIGYMCFVRMTVTDITHEMWLPVMDHKNKAMKSHPYEYQVWDKKKRQMVTKHVDTASMFDVNKTIMRCLVKCIAMFGLGHYIYAGEDLPEPDAPSQIKAALMEKYSKVVTGIQTCLANEDLDGAAKIWFELPDESKKELWVAPTKGGVFTTEDRRVIGSPEFRLAFYGENV